VNGLVPLALVLAFGAPSASAEPDGGAVLAAAAEASPALRLSSRAAAPKPPKVCSSLDFDGVTWPDELTEDDRAALEIALNISGSYEGGDAWANLSDNFDGQGVSVGLLNQCLGQGSLQPMLIRMRDEHPQSLKALVSPDHLKSLLAMLAKWQTAPAQESSLGPPSALDEPGDRVVLKTTAADKASVDWAAANLYAGGKFQPLWKSELGALAASREYVSIQISAAVEDHDRALSEEGEIGVRELRSYLMLFDVVVQNGRLYPEDLSDYAAYVKKTPKAGSTARLEKLLELRLRHVRSKYVEDVRSRKRAIILGTGTVHGEPRNLPVQYCYDGLWPYR
jgi:hypothetical protein